MMDFLKKNMLLTGGAIVVLLALFMYFLMSSNASTAALTSDENSAVSSDLLVKLANLNTIKLNTAVFTDPSFESLTDFSVTIPPENVGRRNPFLPLSGGAAASSNSSITIPTTQ